MRSINIMNTDGPRIKKVGDKILLLLVASTFISRFCVLAYPSVDLLFQILGIGASFVSAALVFSRGKLATFEYSYLILLLAVIMVQGIYTIEVIGQTPFHFFSAAYSYSFCLLLFPCAYLYSTYGEEYFFCVLQKTALLISVYMVCSALLNNLSEITLIEALRERGGNARFGEPELVNLMTIYSCWRIGTEKSKVIDLCCLIFGLFATFYVSRTRVMEVVIVTACYVSLLMCLRGANRKALLISTGCLAVISSVALGIVDNFISSFSITGAEASSTITRLEEASFYLSTFISNPMLGAGMISYESPLHYLVGGKYGNYYPEDIGIVGALGTIGISIIPLYFIPIVYFIYKTYKSDNTIKPLLTGFLVYLLGTSMTLLIAYPFCSPAWPLAMSSFTHSKTGDYSEDLR